MDIFFVGARGSGHKCSRSCEQMGRASGTGLRGCADLAGIYRPPSLLPRLKGGNIIPPEAPQLYKTGHNCGGRFISLVGRYIPGTILFESLRPTVALSLPPGLGILRVSESEPSPQASGFRHGAYQTLLFRKLLLDEFGEGAFVWRAGAQFNDWICH